MFVKLRHDVYFGPILWVMQLDQTIVRDGARTSDAAGPECSKRDDTRTGAMMIGNADEPEGIKGKVDITTLDKTNMTPILVSY